MTDHIAEPIDNTSLRGISILVFFERSDYLHNLCNQYSYAKHLLADGRIFHCTNIPDPYRGSKTEYMKSIELIKKMVYDKYSNFFAGTRYDENVG